MFHSDLLFGPSGIARYLIQKVNKAASLPAHWLAVATLPARPVTDGEQFERATCETEPADDLAASVPQPGLQTAGRSAQARERPHPAVRLESHIGR